MVNYMKTIEGLQKCCPFFHLKNAFIMENWYTYINRNSFHRSLQHLTIFLAMSKELIVVCQRCTHRLIFAFFQLCGPACQASHAAPVGTSGNHEALARNMMGQHQHTSLHAFGGLRRHISSNKQQK